MHRRMSVSNLLLPGLIAVLLGLDLGFHLVPTIKGDPNAVPVTIESLATPTTAWPTTTTAPVRPPSPAPTTPASTEPTSATPPTLPLTTPTTTPLSAPTTTPPTVSALAHDPALAPLPALIVSDPTAVGLRSAARVTSIGNGPRPSGWVQSYVRPGGLPADLMIAVGGDDVRWAGIDARPGEIGGQPLLEQAVTDGPRRLSLEIGGRPVSISALGLTDGELAFVLSGLSVQASSAGVNVGHLPADMQLVASAPGPTATATAYRTNYSGDGWFVELNVDAAVPLVADPVEPARGTDVELRPVGPSPAIVTEIADTGDGGSWYLLSWWRPEGVHVSMLGRGLSLDQTLVLAASVRPATADEWAHVAQA